MREKGPPNDLAPGQELKKHLDIFVHFDFGSTQPNDWKQTFLKAGLWEELRADSLFGKHLIVLQYLSQSACLIMSYGIGKGTQCNKSFHNIDHFERE